MTTWNYAIVKQTTNGDTVYSVRQILYDEDGEPDGCTDYPVTLEFDSLSATRDHLILMLSALSHPMIDLDALDTEISVRDSVQQALDLFQVHDG